MSSLKTRDFDPRNWSDDEVRIIIILFLWLKVKWNKHSGLMYNCVLTDNLAVIFACA